MLALARKLREEGVLGINERNAAYMLIYNRRKLHPLVDDKLLTKDMARQAGVTVPELYAVIEIERQVRMLPELVRRFDDFVVKPARGTQGNGILVITRRVQSLYRTPDGTLIDDEDLCSQVSNILSGVYSIGGRPDRALIEYRVKFDPVFEAVTYRGVPDIRVIVFLGVPVMAMVRLPTRLSHGKANLHQGAIGAGIDIASGRTLSAVWRTSVVRDHPDTGHPTAGVQIPDWRGLLELAARSYEMTGLGYLGIDIVIDRDRGPMILEINARPGLSIQIANRAGLKPRLQAVEQHRQALQDISQRVAFAQQHFGSRLDA